MDRNRFNHDVRQHLTEIPIGTQGIAFDRHELDAWGDEYKKKHGRSPLAKPEPNEAATQRQSRGEFDRVAEEVLRTLRDK